MIECPKCHRQIDGAAVYHGRMLRSLDHVGLRCRRTIAVCEACGIGLEAVEHFKLIRETVRETSDLNEIRTIRKDLGLVEPLAGELRNDGV